MPNYEPNPRVRTKDAIDDTLNRYFRTNNKLIIQSEGHPVTSKIVDPDLEGLFRYHFGTKWGDAKSPSGDAGWVVIPKGRIVAVDPEIQRTDYDLEKNRNVLTICNGGEEQDPDELIKEGGLRDKRAANKPAGVAIQNTFENPDHRLTGNVPSYTNKVTIQLPLFATKEQAEQTEWGSAYCIDGIDYDDPRDVTFEDLEDTGLKPGDHLKSDENGRFVKWGESEDSIEQRVGKVDNVSTELVPQDFLKWIMPDLDDPQGIPELLINRLGYKPEDILNKEVLDPSYQDGVERNAYMPLGIPGLTDGMNIVVEEEAELRTLGEIEAGDKVQLRVPADKGLFDPETLELTDQEGNPLNAEILELAEEAVGVSENEISTLEYMTITGGEHENYNLTIEFVANDANEDASFDGESITVDLDESGDYGATDIQTLINDITDEAPEGVDWEEFEVNTDEEGEVSGSEFDGETIILEGGQSAGAQRVEVYHTNPEQHLISIKALEDFENITVNAAFETTHAIPGLPTNLDWDGVVGSIDIIVNVV